jgi:hypothetical protein
MNHLGGQPEGLQNTGLCFYNTASIGSADTCHLHTVIDICMWEHHLSLDMFLFGSLSHRSLEVSQLVRTQPGNREIKSKPWHITIHSVSHFLLQT